MARGKRATPSPTGSPPPSPRRVDLGQHIGLCGLCGRPMVAGNSVDRHHLVPKTCGGKAAVWMHQVCHRKIHSVLTEKELARSYHTFEALLEVEEIATFVAWVRKKDPEFMTRHRTHARKRK